ncbi:hypothetical protein DFJ74DRAFT_775454 [Hyaloraphidium curvatum]|nr:hypothetical protein DFJ74DRAFT_775454 [Hyaloraphidium curvatum]
MAPLAASLLFAALLGVLLWAAAQDGFRDRRTAWDALAAVRAQLDRDRHAPPAAFVCPPAVPCPPPDLPPDLVRRLADGSWAARDVPLANRSRTWPGQPGVCSTDTTRRVFLESGIDLSSLAAFEPCRLFNALRGRTLWLAGDSQSMSLLEALQNFLSAYAADGRGYSHAPIGVPSVDHVLTSEGIATIPPACAELLHGTRMCHLRIQRSSHRELPYTLEILARAVPHFSSDVFAFNLGVHYRPAQWQLAPDLRVLAKYRAKAREAMGGGYLPRMVWLDTAPQHFSTAGGDYDPARNLSADPCSPFSRGRLESADRGTFNALSDPLVQSISDAHARTWEMAKRASHAHRRVGDCTHYCRPGVPELWVYALAGAVERALAGDAGP